MAFQQLRAEIERQPSAIFAKFCDLHKDHLKLLLSWQYMPKISRFMLISRQRRVLQRFQVTIIGDPGVGKSSLLVANFQKTFSEGLHLPAIFDIQSVAINFQGRPYSVTFWELPGMRFAQISFLIEVMQVMKVSIAFVICRTRTRTSFLFASRL